MELNCLLVDDEPLALNLLESYVKRTSFLKLIGKCSNALDVVKIVQENEVDLIFLDIQMPELSGLELSRFLDPRIRIVFVTAFEQYAIEGFKVNALDYLLKPVSYPEFLKAANKALIWFGMQRAEKMEQPENTSIFVKSDYKLLKVELNKISYIEGLKDYVKIYLEDSSVPVVSLITMKSLEETLPSHIFARVHRSYIVNLTKITVMERNRIVFGKTYIPVSDSYRSKLQQFIDQRVVK